jgi:hypothetical protein
MIKYYWTDTSVYQFEDSFYICGKQGHSSPHLHAGDTGGICHVIPVSVFQFRIFSFCFVSLFGFPLQTVRFLKYYLLLLFGCFNGDAVVLMR